MEEKKISWLVRFLTPKRTEEVKPGLFIKRYRGDDIVTKLKKIQDGKFEEIKKPKYNRITPAAWKGKINWITTIFGAHPIKSTLVFILILFLAWSYHHDIMSLHNLITQYQNSPGCILNPLNITSNASQHTQLAYNFSNLNLTFVP